MWRKWGGHLAGCGDCQPSRGVQRGHWQKLWSKEGWMCCLELLGPSQPLKWILITRDGSASSCGQGGRAQAHRCFCCRKEGWDSHLLCHLQQTHFFNSLSAYLREGFLRARKIAGLQEPLVQRQTKYKHSFLIS